MCRCLVVAVANFLPRPPVRTPSSAIYASQQPTATVIWRRLTSPPCCVQGRWPVASRCKRHLLCGNGAAALQRSTAAAMDARSSLRAIPQRACGCAAVITRTCPLLTRRDQLNACCFYRADEQVIKAPLIILAKKLSSSLAVCCQNSVGGDGRMEAVVIFAIGGISTRILIALVPR